MDLAAYGTLLAASTVAVTSRAAPNVDRPFLDPYCLSERSPAFRIAPRIRGLRRASISFPSLWRMQRGLHAGTAFVLSINTNRAIFHNVRKASPIKHALYIYSSTAGHRRAITCSTSAGRPLGPGACPFFKLFTATISSSPVKREIAFTSTS